MVMERESLDVDSVISNYDKIYKKAMDMAQDDFRRTPQGAHASPVPAQQQPMLKQSRAPGLMDMDVVRYHVSNMIELAKIEKITINVHEEER